jgi:polysaccharide deacetylase family protein (PEP-CTERM system associated)
LQNDLKIKNVFLFSVDLEDVRLLVENGERYAERVPLMTEKYLNFLNRNQSKATFFVVGEVAKKYPSLIKRISDNGHEIACHSNKHIPLDRLDARSFREDLKENIKMLNDAGIEKIYGFRAPTYSMTDKTTWVYDELAEMGFVYSSSVLPAKNPLYGWPDFGREIKIMNNKIWEVPISVFRSQLISFPFAGGIYFRLLPFCFSRCLIRKTWKRDQAVIGYIHPYDIDGEQEYFMHPELNNNKLYNKLMYVNRNKLLNKFDKTISMGGIIMPYIEFIKNNFSS